MEALLPLTNEICQKNTRCINALTSKSVFYYNNNVGPISVKLRPFIDTAYGLVREYKLTNKSVND